MITFLNRTISWSFYALFLLVPIVFNDKTSELFEFNKLWLTFGLTTIIIGSWIIKMILEKQIRIQRTPLDIPLLLFLGSQLISTIISLDPHTSFWGYYSRFNGGFLSLLTYVLLYYAFVTFAGEQRVKEAQGTIFSQDERRSPVPRKNLFPSELFSSFIFRCLFIILASGIFVSLWGIPAHFGYDPTCLVFRGSFDVSCWTVAFQPKVRIFSTLGQPDWLSAYLAILIPLAIGFGLYFLKQSRKFLALGSLLSAILFYIAFLYAHSRGGFIGLIFSLVLFFGWYVWQEKKSITKLFSKPQKLVLQYWYILVCIGSIFLFTFLIGSSFDKVDSVLLPGIVQKIALINTPTKAAPVAPVQPKSSAVSTGEFGGTDSGKIRLFVWSGALQAFVHYPIFGTGVETFAYAYYLFMPPGHNLTSEFGYLYNKAHNEYLNYLATTGIVGLGTYLLMIGWFLWIAIKQFKTHSSVTNSQFITAGLLASYIGLLIINFFGFSVVIINIFLFLIPAFVFVLQEQLHPEKSLVYPKTITNKATTSSFQWILSGGVFVVACYLLYVLLLYWNADRAFGLGQNLVNAGDYQSAYQPLHQAAEMRPGEPTFEDELSLDDAVLAVALAQQNKSATGTPTQLAQEAIAISNNLTTNHPNIVTYWKTRVRIMYSLSQLNPQYMQEAFIAIQKASLLAPTDAKVSYNLGLIQGQTGHVEDAIVTLQNTIKLKKDYRDAYYALGLFYHAAGVDKSGKITNADDAQKAIDTMHFILDNFGDDAQASDALKAWNAQ